MLREIRDGRALVATLADTHLRGEEADAMMGYIKGTGYECTIEPADDEGRAGVLIMWKAGVMVKVGRATTA